MEFLVFFWNLQGSHFIFPKVKVFRGVGWGCLLSLVLRNIIETGLSGVPIERWQGKGPQVSLETVWPNVDTRLWRTLRL